MVDPLTNSLRDLMARQHARQEIAALIDKYGDDFVILTAQSISVERIRKAHDAYVKERDAARADATNPMTAGQV